jgi:HPt (histidine-containing phosphotransfer) domain-containing protein
MPAIDATAAIAQLGNERIFNMMIKRFAPQVEQLMGKIEVAYNDGGEPDFAMLRAESHSLKGSSKYMAANRLAAAAEALQVASEPDGDRSDVDTQVGELREAAAEVYAFLAAA